MILTLLSLKQASDKQKENFTSYDTSPASMSYVAGYLVVALLLMFVFDYGAARLSYFYNSSTGTTGGMLYVWAILAFLFSDIYYPFYSFFLNPISKKSGNNIQVASLNTALKNAV